MNVKQKKTKKNFVNDDDKCFQYAQQVTLDYKEAGRHPQRISYNITVAGKE